MGDEPISLIDVQAPAALASMASACAERRALRSKVILCSSPKGGCGKTTTVRSLASFAAKEGLRVATIDLDPQKTLSQWWDRRSEELPIIINFTDVPPREVTAAITEIADRGEYDLVIIDTPPGVEALGDQLVSILNRADLVLAPTRDSGEDLLAVTPWMRLVRDLGRPAYFLLCAVDKDQGMLDEAKEYLARHGGGNLCPHEVQWWQVIRRSFFSGRGPADFTAKNEAKAATSYELVWLFVKRQLGMEA